MSQEYSREPGYEPFDLVGMADIAVRLGVKTATVSQWRNRNTGFPMPMMFVSKSPIWNYPDVQKWAEETGRTKR